jgi:hypothetical protein
MKDSSGVIVRVLRANLTRSTSEGGEGPRFPLFLRSRTGIGPSRRAVFKGLGLSTIGDCQVLLGSPGTPRGMNRQDAKTGARRRRGLTTETTEDTERKTERRETNQIQESRFNYSSVFFPILSISTFNLFPLFPLFFLFSLLSVFLSVSSVVSVVNPSPLLASVSASLASWRFTLLRNRPGLSTCGYGGLHGSGPGGDTGNDRATAGSSEAERSGCADGRSSEWWSGSR